VRDHQHAARERGQVVGEPGSAGRVEVVRRLVEHEDVRPAQEQPAKHEARLLAAADICQRRIVGQMRDVQTLADLGQAGLGEPAAQGGPAVLGLAVGGQGVGGAVGGRSVVGGGSAIAGVDFSGRERVGEFRHPQAQRVHLAESSARNGPTSAAGSGTC